MAAPVFTVETFSGTEGYPSASERDTFTMGTWRKPEEHLLTFSGSTPWRFVNPLNLALQPLYLTQEEAEELEDLLRNPRAFPALPVRGLPRGERSRLPHPTSEA